MELTSTPTAAGREERVMSWIDAWLKPRRKLLSVKRDDAGNYLILRKDRPRGVRPLLITAHLDHPAFVVVSSKTPARRSGAREVELEFRGGVHAPYFVGTRIEAIDCMGIRHGATIVSLDAKAQPFMRVRARLDNKDARTALMPGDIARWALGAPRIATRELPSITPGGATRAVRVIETHACDDLAAAAAALAAFDRVLREPAAASVGLLLTVAEEVGFIGAIHAAKHGFIPANARLLCLENSRSFPHDSPIGAGAILRVGDRISVFSPSLTNTLSALFTAHAKAHPTFRWQRRLMPGGACEATAFAAFGFESTCLCLPLGNYHNMRDIDTVVAAVAAKKRVRGVIDFEFVAIDDFHSLVEMLLVSIKGLTATDAKARRKKDGGHRQLMESIYSKSVHVLAG